MTEFDQTNLGTANEYQEIQSAPKFVDCWISFGGNVGDVKATFDAALALLSLHCHIRLGRRSSIYSTSQMGSQAGGRFLNSVCELSTQLCPRRLLGVLQSVETQLGRVRDIRWGPRTLDLDLLSYGEQIVNEPDLMVPHPALTYRRFVLDPLVEVDPNWCHPVFHEPADRLLARLNPRPLKVSLFDVCSQQTATLATQLGQRFPHLQFVDAAETGDVLTIRTTSSPSICGRTLVDLRHSPGDMLEQLTSALTAIFDAPERISEW